jgi:DNA-binding response OmpR family regulator
MNASTHVLLVDDDRRWLETLADYLRDRGLVVHTAEEPRRGLLLLEQQEVRVAVLDFRLPEITGLELLRLIRQRWQHVRVLLLSSEEDPSLAAQALAEGAEAFLSKTMTPRLLLGKLLQFLEAAFKEPPRRQQDPFFRWDRLLPPPHAALVGGGR